MTSRHLTTHGRSSDFPKETTSDLFQAVNPVSKAPTKPPIAPNTPKSCLAEPSKTVHGNLQWDNMPNNEAEDMLDKDTYD